MTWAILPYPEYKQALIELLESPSPRILAVVGGALLDQAMDRTLRERFREDDGAADSILRVDGPLGNLGPKIDLLYLLGGIDQKHRNAMKGLAEVRNFFAHQTGASFDSLDPKFLNGIGRLTLHQGRTHYPHHLFGPDSATELEPVKNRRDQFIVNLKLSLIALMRDRVSHVAYSNQPLTDEQIRAKFPELQKPSNN